MPVNNALFTAKSLGLEYDVAGTMVRGILPCDIVIPECATTIIFGASGSGKSSLLNVLSGLQKPTTGSLHFRNEELYSKSQNELAYFRANELGIVYQTNYWVKSLNVLDNISMPLYFQGESKVLAHKKARAALERVDMVEFANQYPILLSGGEQQRVAMARAIISDPSVIIADEPTGSLDSKNGDKIIELLKQLHKENGKTIILVTHNMEYLHIANHLLEIQDGKVDQIEESKISKTVKSILSETQERISKLMKGHVS